MECTFYYCIYNKKNTCILDNISIDGLGMCCSCEIVSVPEKILEALKKKRLDEIDETWKDYDG